MPPKSEYAYPEAVEATMTCKIEHTYTIEDANTERLVAYNSGDGEITISQSNAIHLSRACSLKLIEALTKLTLEVE